MEDIKPGSEGIESEVLVFIPEGEENTRKTIFDLYFRLAVIFLIWFLFLVVAEAKYYHFKNGFSMLTLFLVMALITGLSKKYPTRLSIDSKRKLFIINYLNFLGKEKSKEIGIQKADIIYKYVVIIWGSHWELLVYSNYFTNRFRISEKTEGFTKEQLETISKTLKEVQSGVK